MVELVKKYRIIILACILIITNFIYLWYTEREEMREAIILTNMSSYESDELEEIESDNTIERDREINMEIPLNDKEEVPVYLCGAVKMSGVYFVLEDAIIQDVVQLGGGMTEEADINAINLARKINPNEKIYIPKQGEQIDKTVNSYDNSNDQVLGQVKININQATKEQLEELPGIGEVKAQQIITYRNQMGLFKNCDELKNVSGVGEKTYSMLEQLITIE